MNAEENIWKNWMWMFLFFQFFLWFPLYVTFFWIGKEWTYHIINFPAVIWLVVSSFTFFFYPSLLYSRKGAQSGDTESKEPSNFKNYEKALSKKNEPPDPRLAEIMQVIELSMMIEKYFLIAGYSIGDFSRDIELPVYQISKCLNHVKGWGFVDFINQKRISFCKEKFDRGEWMNLTLEAVSESCGFTNRNSFTKAFLKFEGLTPSAYRLRGQNQEGLLS